MSWYLNFPPEKNGWVKYFHDGTMEFGYDRDVDLGRASWTRGKLANMSGVAMKSGDVISYLLVAGEEESFFWQSDDYEVELGSRNPSRVVRRIEQQLDDKTWRIIEIDLKTSLTREFISPSKI